MTPTPTHWTCRETEDAEVEIVSNGSVSYRVMGGDGEALARALNNVEGGADVAWQCVERYKAALKRIAHGWPGHTMAAQQLWMQDEARAALEEAQ